jgi:hypothetical protein
MGMVIFYYAIVASLVLYLNTDDVSVSNNVFSENDSDFVDEIGEDTDEGDLIDFFWSLLSVRIDGLGAVPRIFLSMIPLLMAGLGLYALIRGI